MTHLIVNEQAVRDESRLVVIATVKTLLRLAEGYQETFGPDLNRVMVALAVGVITGERPITASDASDSVRRFGVPIPSTDLVRCTALGVAAATGLPRETARRTMQQMVDDGVLLKDEKVGVRINPEILQGDEFQYLVLRHTGEVARLANALIGCGVLVQG